jgi:hypothetical protein
MEREYRADVMCWAKNLLKISVLTLHSALFFTTAAMKCISVLCKILATTLQKTLEGKTNILKILNFEIKILIILKPPARNIRKFPTMQWNRQNTLLIL